MLTPRMLALSARIGEAERTVADERRRAFDTTAADVVFQVNPDWSTMRGVDASGRPSGPIESVDGWLERHVPRDEHPRLRAAIEAAVADRRTFAIRHRFRRADGASGWAITCAAPIVDETGEVVEWFGAAQSEADCSDEVGRLRESEAQKIFFLALIDALRSLHDADEMLRVASRMVGERLGTANLRYARIESRNGEPRYRVDDSDAAPGTRTVDGDYPLARTPVVSEALARGETVVVSDVATDGRLSPQDKASYASLGVASLIATPSIRNGRLVGVLAALDSTSRPWTVRDVALLEAAAEFTRAEIDRAAAESALRESEARARMIFESAGDGIWIAGRNGAFAYANPAACRMLGYPLERLLALGVRDVMRPADWRRLSAITETLTPGRPVDGVWKLRRADGGYAPFELSISLAPDGYWQAIGRDVSERLRADALLSESAQRKAFMLTFSDALRAQPDVDSVALCAVKLLSIWLRADFCYILTFQPEADRLRPTHGFRSDGGPSLPSEAAISSFPATYDRLIRGTVVVNDIAKSPDLGQAEKQAFAEKRIGALIAAQPPVGSPPPVWCLAAVSAKARRWTRSEILLVEEASERTWAAMERARAEQQIAQYERMEALGRLTGGIAHDLNNLLAIILGNLQLLEKQIDGEPGRQSLRDALEAVRMGDRLTSQLLCFARKDALSPELFDVSERAEAIAHLLRRSFGERIEIETRLPDGALMVKADRSAFENAMVNIAVNARDAMPDGGTLSIATGAVDVDPARAKAAAVASGGYVCLTIRDTGCGMTAESRRRAFEPFFTTKKPGKGTGLGLSGVYAFARRSGGFAEIDSAVGVGTTLRVFLPRMAPPGRGRSPTRR